MKVTTAVTSGLYILHVQVLEIFFKQQNMATIFFLSNLRNNPQKKIIFSTPKMLTFLLCMHNFFSVLYSENIRGFM